MYRRFAKRLFDLALTVPALVVLTPVLVVLALLVRRNLGRPVLFRQRRPGRNEVLFDIIKFRSMTTACAPSGKLLPDRERLTRFGRWLRAAVWMNYPSFLMC